eukprot:5832623-Alexandrium_andersonii.AAC.1
MKLLEPEAAKFELLALKFRTATYASLGRMILRDAVLYIVRQSSRAPDPVAIRNPCIRSPRSESEDSRTICPARPHPRGSAPFCAPNTMVTTKQVGARAGGTFR